MKNQGQHKKKNLKLSLKNQRFFIFTAQFIIGIFLPIELVKAATAAPVLSVVQSEENTQHWAGITKRLQTIGVPYCVLPLSNVRSVADWGDRRLLFLPNIETLTPAQAIALQTWMNKGGNLIASGPVGSLSAPGVRELLKNLLGSYWGFSLKDTQKLNPPKTKIPNWLTQNGLCHNQLLNLDTNYPGPVLAAHPNWANNDQQGNTIPIGQTKPFFDPANPELRQYLLKLYKEIVTEYQVDGLQLDYIRYPFQDPSAGRTYGCGKAARAQFQQLTGVDPISITPAQAQLWQQWTAFRTQQVDSFVAQVSQMLRQTRTNLILSVAVFPLPEAERIQKLQQHWEVWARRGDIDLIIPMTYAQDTVRFQTLAQPWIASTQLGSTLLVPGIRLLSLPTMGAFDQLQLIRDLQVSGYALFAAENLNNELHQLFSNTQGQVQSAISEPIPHRHPFNSAVTSYIALQREWHLILQKEKLQILPSTILEFHHQAEVVKNALNQLAAAPSTSKLLTTRAALTRFQTQFRVWMRQQGKDNTYQVKAWENRLAAIERLLRYGEQRFKLDSQNQLINK